VYNQNKLKPNEFKIGDCVDSEKLLSKEEWYVVKYALRNYLKRINGMHDLLPLNPRSHDAQTLENLIGYGKI